jgi:hypothetical protein
MDFIPPVKISQEEGSNKKPRGSPAKFGHFHELGCVANTFLQRMMAPGIGMLTILDGFRPFLVRMPGKMIGKATHMVPMGK